MQCVWKDPARTALVGRLRIGVTSAMRILEFRGPGSSIADCRNWSEEDTRELRLVLLADELTTLAYQAVDWRQVAVLGRAIVALAEANGPRLMK